MKSTEFPAWLSCSRNNQGEFHFSIKDADAVDMNIEITLTAEQFAFLVTGGVVSDLVAKVRRPAVIGKKRISEDREIECPLKSYDRAALERWLRDNAQEEGWELDTHLGSQHSVQTVHGATILRYRVKKWIDKGN